MAITGDTLASIALDAGKLIMEIYEGDFDFSRKGDDSPVTLADEKAEALILKALAEADPDLKVIAEEAMAAGEMPEHGARFALVDPLDGTKEFINRNTDFTVNIALVRDGTPEVGVVYAPCTGRFFSGRPGRAELVELNEAGEIAGRRPIRVRAGAAPLTIVASRSHRTPETDDFIGQFEAAEIVSVGSSLKFCLVANGEADIYPRFGRTMEWDTAAGHAVLKGAGGEVVRFDNHEPLTYGKPIYENPFFIAYAPGVELKSA